MAQRAQKSDVQAARAVILDAVWRQAGVTQKELVMACSPVKTATVAKILRRLIQEGEISETINLNDHREKAYMQAY